MGAEIVHVLLVSFAGQGHVNPLLRLAKRIASKGIYVTFSSTTDVGNKIKKANKTVDAGEPRPIGKGHIRFEFFSDGWEVDDLRRFDLDAYMPQLKTVGSKAVAELICRQAERGRPVSCVINNPFVPWVLDVAADMGIPSGMVWVQSCAVFSTYYHYYHGLVKFPDAADPDVSVDLPGMPMLKAVELPTFLIPSNPYPALTEAILAQFGNLSRASWMFVNSFEELERDTLRALSEVAPLIPVGPLIELADGTDDDSSQVRADLFKVADCLEWLDAQEPGSVVYASVGSVVLLSREEIKEMAYGLRNSGQPFLWVVREASQELLPEGFLEEAKGQGLVVSWSPQDQVLLHRSVGCFLTHCGWNSTLECLTSGVPVITFPQWGDQVPDAKFLVDVYRVGVHLRRKIGAGTESAAPVTTPSFTRGDVERSIEEVMAGPEAEEMRKNAMKWKAAAREAVGAGGSSDRNIQAFVEEIRSRGPCSGGGVGGDAVPIEGKSI